MRVESRLCSEEITTDCSIGCRVEESSTGSIAVVVCGPLWEERAHEDRKTLSVWSPCSSSLSCPLLTKERRGWAFQHFQVLLPVIVLEFDERAVPLKMHSQNVILTPQHIVSCVKTPEEKQKDMAASQVKDVS